ncbi:MAG TPA: zinc ribbon domain-containing protein [Gemmatimonadales bacterium]|nr:zinc ribbon domain-containing protein [Gemmatimonadales bacterium]
MSDVERLFRHMVTSLLESDPAQLQRPIPLHELMVRVLPYRVIRRTLGVDSSEDYELLILRLAGGEGGFATVEPEPVHVRFAEEAVSVNPNLAVLQEFKDATLIVAQDAMAWVLAGHSKEQMYAPSEEPREAIDELTLEAETAAAPAPAPPPPAAPATPPPPPRSEAPVFERVPPRSAPPTSHAPPPPPPVTPPAHHVPAAAPASRTTPPGAGAKRCSQCGGRLPLGRQVNFCPHCGHSQGAAECPYCEAAVEYGWKHCITCGGELQWE